MSLAINNATHDVEQKDGRKPADPDYDPRTIYIPSSAWDSFTPFEKQFWEVRPISRHAHHNLTPLPT